jgi:hypothetical protein
MRGRVGMELGVVDFGVVDLRVDEGRHANEFVKPVHAALGFVTVFGVLFGIVRAGVSEHSVFEDGD